MTQSPKNVSKGFTKAFWVSNTVELFERMAYYAVFIVLTIYLSSILGFNDLEASMISGRYKICCSIRTPAPPDSDCGGRNGRIFTGESNPTPD